MKGRWSVIAEETPMTECGWECRGLQLVMMLIDGLNLRPKVKSQDITVVFHRDITIGSFK